MNIQFEKNLQTQRTTIHAQSLEHASVVLDASDGLSFAVKDTVKTIFDAEGVVGALMGMLQSSSSSKITLALDGFKHPALAAKALMRAIYDANYTYHHDLSEAPKFKIEAINLAYSDVSLDAVIDEEVHAQKGIQLTKDLVTGPANRVNPAYMAKTAQDLAARSSKVKVEILSYDELLKKGFGSFCAVARGSNNKGLLALIHYQGADASAPLHAFVGKGITFDSGGLSLKPAMAMMAMNTDMGGAGSVLGLMEAVVDANLKVNVLGVLACAENMPDADAYRPSDVIKSYSGKTIEVLNTDAEGRLVLCDAISYTIEKYKPARLIDIATLTGAQIVALGKHRTAMYSNNDALAGDLEKASHEAMDAIWRMPLGPEYTKMVSSKVADLCNLGKPFGDAGSITAASFLGEFVGETHWAHLDIAGPSRGEHYGTGRPVALLYHYLRSLES